MAIDTDVREEFKNMTIVDQMYANFCKCAKTIPGFKVGQKEDVSYDITDLANAYLDAMDSNDSEGMNRYISALMVRYWHMVPYLWDRSKSSKLGMEDMVMWIYEGFAKAFKYRSWVDPSKPVSKDPKGAEKCFNQCITSVRQYWYKHFNTNMSRINYVAMSLDALHEALGDAFDDHAPQEGLFSEGDSCRDIISTLVAEGRLFDAVVVDLVCFGDSFRETRGKARVVTGNGELVEDIQTCNHEFDMKRLLACMKSIDREYLEEFGNAYGVDPDSVAKALGSVGKRDVSGSIQDAFSRIREDERVLSLLC